MKFTKDKPKVDPKLDEVKPVPNQAGSPEITIRKEWIVDRYRITADGKVLSINPLDFSSSLYNSICFSRDLCAAMADALLQAAP